jgi:ornithine lipid hydroxylase
VLWIAQFLKRYFVLILVTQSIALFALASHFGVNLELALLTASIISIVCGIMLERLMPFNASWAISNGDVRTDTTSAAVLIVLIDPAIKALAPIAITGLYAFYAAPRFLSNLSLWQEIVCVLLLAELGKYVAHRLHHQFKSLWWLHAMHHSSERMYWLNGLRFHPLNYALNFALSILPLMLLGASPEALLGYLAITQPVVLIQHANIALDHRWLNWIFSTPEVHRWHHTTEAHTANNNFSNALLIWDHVFGSFRSAKGFDQATPVGLFASSSAVYPKRASYFAQLKSMFAWPCCA